MSVKLTGGKAVRSASAAGATGSAAAPDVPRLIRGRWVERVGEFASMTREEFVELVEAHGGQVASGRLGAGVSLLVVGQKDWLLKKDGTAPDLLRKARIQKQRAGRPLAVLSEEQFLEALGLDQYSQSVHQVYTTPTLCEVLGIAPGRVRAWVKAGLIKPVETRGGVWHFDFRQVSAAKTLCDLARSGVSLSRLRRSLQQLRAWLPEAEVPLQQLSLLENGQLTVRLDEGDLAEADGQLRLDFEQVQPTPSPLPPAPMRLHAGPSTAAQWYEQAVEQQAAGYLADSVESYRQALLRGGPDADVCFDLAHALAAMGKRERAAERYAQAVELRPGFSDAWNNLGTILAELGHRDEACHAFRRALEIDAHDLRAQYNLADTLDEMGFPAQAAAHWRAYLRQDRDSPWAAHARQRLAAVG